MNWWSQLNATLRILLGVAILICGIILFRWLAAIFGPRPAESPIGPGDGFVEVHPGNTIPRDDLPPNVDPSDYSGQLDVEVPDTVKHGDTVVVRKIKVRVLVPAKQGGTPLVRVGDGSTSYMATYGLVATPIIAFEFSPFVGWNLGLPDLQNSPVVGASFLSLFNTVHVGVAFDRYAGGIQAGYNVWREFDLTIKANPKFMRYGQDVGIQIGLEYRF